MSTYSVHVNASDSRQIIPTSEKFPSDSGQVPTPRHKRAPDSRHKIPTQENLPPNSGAGFPDFGMASPRFWAVKSMFGLLCLPLTWGHASDGFEGAEEGLLVGEAGLYIDIGNLLVGILAQEALGVFDAVAVDELGEGTAVQGIDAVGNEAPVTA